MIDTADGIFKTALSRPCDKLFYRRELPPNQKVIPRFIIYDVYDPPQGIDIFNYKLRVVGGLVERG